MPKGIYQRPTVEQRLWSRVDKSAGPDACWTWTGSLRPNGYGQIRRGRFNCSAHRAVYELQIGPIPDGMVICHRCDNRRCVNPAHLFLGTPADNSADMVTKGRSRSPAGELNHEARLTEDAVREIRNLVQQGVCQRRIAERFGVSPATVCLVVKSKTWRHVQ